MRAGAGAAAGERAGPARRKAKRKARRPGGSERAAPGTVRRAMGDDDNGFGGGDPTIGEDPMNELPEPFAILSAENVDWKGKVTDIPYLGALYKEFGFTPFAETLHGRLAVRQTHSTKETDQHHHSLKLERRPHK